MDTSPGARGNDPNLDEGPIDLEKNHAEYLAKISALPSGPAYADQNFGGDPEKGVSTRTAYSADSVVLTLEFLSDRGAKVLIFALRMSMLLSLILLIIQLWWKLSNDKDTLAYNDTILMVNLVVGIFATVLLLLAAAFYFLGIYKAMTGKKKWNARRKRYCILGGLNLLFEFLVMVFFVASNAYGVAQPCSWFLLNIQVLAYFRWTFFVGLIAMQILQALALLPLDAIPWYKGNVYVGLDLPSKVYVKVFFIFFAPVALLQFLRFGTETSWFSSDYLCQKYYSSSCEVVDFSADCSAKKYPCYYTEAASVLSILTSVLLLLEFIIYFAMILFARRQLRKLPYQEHRISYIELGFQLETRMIACILYVLSLVIFAAVKSSSCGSLILYSMGDGSMQIVYATVVLFQVVLASPAVQFKASKIKLHAWLQDFAWLERDVAAKLAARPFQGEPCFCYETSLKMFYFCNLIYDIDDVPDSPYTLDVALGLYNLTHYRILFHKKQDAKCVVAWNPETRTIVFSFRGTATMANVLADIKIWRRPHPPARGQYVLHTQPMVHVGFLETWEDSGLKDEVLALLQDVMNGGDGNVSSTSNPAADDDGKYGGGDGADVSVSTRTRKIATEICAASGSGIDTPLSKQQVIYEDEVKTSISNSEAPWRVLCTGHSLGGALAHLCSYDISETHGDRVHLTCTTFGAPRPGNHAFARSFRETVNDAWDIFHPDDAVARAGKFIFLYKRAANTVIISPAGELVVRPTYAETAVRRGISPRLSQHLLTKYAHSLGAILKASMCQDGQIDWRKEPQPPLENNNPISDPEKLKVTSTQEALRVLFGSDYVNKFLTHERALRLDSLLRMAGAPTEDIEEARRQRLAEEAAEAAAKSRQGNSWGNCSCIHDGIVLNWIPSLEEIRIRFWKKRSELELHVQD